MKQFSVFEYTCLSKDQKSAFNKALAQKLKTYLIDIQNDDVLNSSTINSFVTSSGGNNDASSIVTDLFSSISSGIQVGSGNLGLYLNILNAFTETWSKIN